MTVRPDYDKQIHIDRAGITIGGEPVPGCIVEGGADQVVVRKSGLISEHYTVTVTFLTGLPPTFGPGVRRESDGSLVILRPAEDDSESGPIERSVA